jgi:hypothetical protein
MNPHSERPLTSRSSALSERARQAFCHFQYGSGAKPSLSRRGTAKVLTLLFFLTIFSSIAAPRDPDTYNAVQQILTNRLPIVVDNLLDLNRRLNSVELKLSTLSNQPASAPAPQVDMRAITQSISSTITELNKGTLNQVTQVMTAQWSKLTNELAATISARLPKASPDSGANISESLSNLNRNVSLLLSMNSSQAAQPNTAAKTAGFSDNFMLWGITLGVISLASLGAIFWLFGVTQIASKRVEAVYQAAGQIYNLIRENGTQNAAEQAEAMLQRIQQQTTKAQDQTTQRTNTILQQAENQAAHTQEKLLAAINEFRAEARNTANLLEQKLSSAKLEPLSQGAERLAKTLDVFEGRLEATKNVFSDFEHASVQLKQQIEERKHLETLEQEAKDKLHLLEQQRIALLEARHSMQSERSEVVRQDGEMNKALWPAAFLNGALGNWRKRIMDGVIQGDLAATTLWLAMIHVGALCRQPSPAVPQIAAALHNMSVEAHRYWKDGADDFNDTTIRWRDEFNALVASRGLPLQIQAIHPEDRFDGDRMVCAEGSSNSRLAVKEPLSWVIMDRSNPERPKVLHHGLVLTA